MKNIKLLALFAVLLLSAFVSTAWAVKAEAPVSYSVSYANNIITITGGGTTTSWTITSTNGFSYWKTDDSHALANGMSVKIDGKVLVYPTYCVTWGTSATFTFTAPDSIAITGVTFKFANTVVAATSTSEPGTTFTVTLDAEKSFTGFEVTYGKIKGKCGTSATWSLSKQNKKYTALTIGGSGAMSDYDHDESSIWRTTAPWGWDLTSVTIGNSITSIGNYAFIGSQQLSSLTIGKSVTSIGDAAFDHCDALTEVTLPASVNSLGDGAFKNCVGLTRVNIKKTDGLVSLGKNAFNGTALQYIVALTPALAVQYQSASNWSTHKAKLRVVLDDDKELYNYLFTATGTADDAAYEIANGTDLRNLSAVLYQTNRSISKGKTFRQTASIDLSSGGDFTPIGSVVYFEGVYDGQGNAITGLSAKSNQYYVGLFGDIQGASIRNIVLVSPSVKSAYAKNANAYVGAIIGNSLYSNTVENCYVINPTLGFDNTSDTYYLGAIIGNSSAKTTVFNSYYYDNVHDYATVGYGGTGTLTNVSRVRKVTFGKGVAAPATVSAEQGFVYDIDGDNKVDYFYREGLDLTLGYSGTLPTGTHVVYSVNGTALSGDTYTVNSTDGDVTITANVYYSVTLGDNLRVTTTPAITYENVDYYSSGTTITVEPTNASSIVEGVGGVSGYTIAADKRSFSFTMPSKGVEISATTSEVHTVNITGGVIISDAYATIDNVKYCKPGDTYTLTVANENEIIDEITGVDATIKNDQKSATFTMPSGDVEITAKTSEVHTVNITGGVIISDAYATIDNVKYYKTDSVYTLTVANENEIIDEITGVEATIAGNRGSARFTMPEKNVEITATTVLKSEVHTVNITGGVIISDAYATIDNVKYYKTDSVYTLTVANENEFISEISGVTTSNAKVKFSLATDSPRATFTMPSGNVTITAATSKIWGGGDGSANDPYTISSAFELDILSKRVNAGNSYGGKYFKLIKDIKFDYEGKWEGVFTNTKNLADNFIAIGTKNKPFKGNFNGDRKTIRGIRINKSDDLYQGLFGFLGEGAVVDSVKLADVVILGFSNTGGIAGYNSGKIRYCTVDSVLIKGDGWYYGGVVGYNNNKGTVSNNTSSATLKSSRGQSFGGVVGYNYHGDVSGNLAIGVTIPAVKYHGAIVGRLYDGSLSNNFYTACTVGSDKNVTNVGIGYNDDEVAPHDVTDKNGAVSMHVVILDGDVSVTSPKEPIHTDNDKNVYYKVGETITLTVANENEIIDAITGVEATIANDQKSATFTMPTGDVEISAATSEVHTVNITGGVIISDAYATIDNVKYYKKDSVYTLTVAKENEIIDEITGVEATINNDRKTATFTMPSKNVTITATTISISDIHTVNITGGVIISDAYATIGDTKYYKKDSVYTLTVANKNEIIDEITGKTTSGAVTITINDDKKTASFTMPNQNVTIEAATSEVHTVSVSKNLTISKEYVTIGDTKYYKTDSVYTLTVVNENEIIDEIKGVEATIDDDRKSATFKMSTGDVEISATTSEVHTVSVPDGLTISDAYATIGGVNYYKAGETYTLTTANANDTISSISGVTASISDDKHRAVFNMPTNDVTVDAVLGFYYIDENGEKKYCYDCAVLTSETITNSSSGWYIVLGTVEYSKKMRAVDGYKIGDLNLILADGASLTVNVEDGNAIEAKSIAIYGQEQNTGALTAESKNNGSGIYTSQGDIAICGGSVTATGYSDENSFVFYIGGGIYANRGNIVISGGTVAASGFGKGDYVAGIYADYGNISISGGSVSATGYVFGIYASSGDIAISGGKVTANGFGNKIYYGQHIAGINGDHITISGGSVSATGSEYGFQADNHLTLGWNDAENDQIMASSYYGGVIAEGKSFVTEDGYFVSGSLTAKDKRAIEGKVLKGAASSLLTMYLYKDHIVKEQVAPGKKPANPVRRGYKFLGWCADVDCTTEFVFKDSYTENDTAYAKWELLKEVSYIDEDGNTQSVSDYTVLTDDMDASVLEKGWYVVLDKVHYAYPVKSSGDLKLVLADGASLTVDGGESMGIEAKSIEIYGQEGQSGALSASGKYGIYVSGNVAINGGMITATGADGGIYASGNVAINGGIITATGADKGFSASGNVIIAEGKAFATEDGYFVSDTLTVKDLLAVNGKTLKITSSSLLTMYLYEDHIVKEQVAPGKAPANPVRRGYKFLGWCADVDCTTEFVFKDSYTENDTAYAKWVPLKEVSYIDEDGNTQSVSDYTVLTDDMDASVLEDGWYVVLDKVHYAYPVKSSGDLKLVLADGASLTVDGGELDGIEAESIEIYGQEGQSGSLTVVSEGIGMSGISAWNFDISGGVVSVTGNEKGIYASNVTINGGAVTVTGNQKGISASNVTINGGAVTATGFNVGIYSSLGSIAIYGGSVTAKGNQYGIYAYNGDIFLGWTDQNDGITASNYSVVQNYKVVIDDGKFFVTDEGYLVSGTLTAKDLAAIAGKTLKGVTPVQLNISLDKVKISKVNVAPGKAPADPVRSGYKFQGWYADVDCTIDFAFKDSYTENDIAYAKWDKLEPVSYIDEKGEWQQVSDYTVLTNDMDVSDLKKGWYVVLGEVNYTYTVYSSDSLNIILADGASLTVNTGDYGIQAKNIAIYGQEEQTGTLSLAGPLHGLYANGGDISINGGKVAFSRESSTCIWATSGNVAINGGKVVASNDGGIGIISSNITLGWIHESDSIAMNGSIKTRGGVVKVAEGKSFKDEYGIVYTGTLSAEQVAAITGSTLTPMIPESVKSLTSTDIVISDITTQAYTGSAICPEDIKVTDGKKVLVPNTDYTVKCSNNVNVGTATMTISGDGNYKDVVEKTFEIVPKVILASGAVQVLKDQNGVRAVLDGEYKTDNKVVEISTGTKVNAVEFKRTFKKGKHSTIMLPFSIDANKVSGANFYQITDIKVEINDNGDKKDTIWGPVSITQVEEEIKANTPYLLGPTETSLSFDIGKEGVVLNTSEMKPYTFTKEGVQWEFRGTYHYFDFGKDSTQLIKKSYGFAAKDQDNGVGVGKFSWTSAQSFILPMRCYLVYNRLKDNGNGEGQGNGNGNGDGQGNGNGDGNGQSDGNGNGNGQGDGGAKPQMVKAKAPSRSIYSSIPETLEVQIVDEKGGKTVIGTLNTRSGELRLKPRPKHTYDLKGRRVNATRKAKGVYVER